MAPMTQAATNTLKDLGGSILGTTNKAMLIIHSDSSFTPVTSKLNQRTEDALTHAKGTGLKAVSDAVTNHLGAGFHTLQVQYNPSSITIAANALSTPFQALQQNIDNGIPNQNMRDPSVVLSVELVFDEMNTKDAFMLDKIRLSAGDAVSAVSAILKKDGYSVQPQTNGLLAAILRDSTRCVSFKWADMTFTGELTEVSAKYTMFSVSGKPIRSLVRLNIQQEVKMASDINYWNNAFDKSFGDSTTTGIKGGRSTANKLGNLLNIGF
ncbi:MAG: hypothetical protein RSD32_01755 [Oscillospiraceae bacterium]